MGRGGGRHHLERTSPLDRGGCFQGYRRLEGRQIPVYIIEGSEVMPVTMTPLQRLEHEIKQLKFLRDQRSEEFRAAIKTLETLHAQIRHKEEGCSGCSHCED